MKRCVGLLSLVASIALIGGVLAQATKSGPQVGQEVPGPFHPLNINGPNAGEKYCLYCANGDNPVAVVFARDVSPELTNLIKKIDASTAANKKHSMGSYVVFCSDRKGLVEDLKTLAAKEKLRHTILSIDNPAGPDGYGIAKTADVTVLLYTGGIVKANHSFTKGGLKTGAIETIVKDVAKILPTK